LKSAEAQYFDILGLIPSIPVALLGSSIVCIVIFQKYAHKSSSFSPPEITEKSEITKEVISTQKNNHASCKKGTAQFCSPVQDDQVVKAKKWLWWFRLMAKILITTIQVDSE